MHADMYMEAFCLGSGNFKASAHLRNKPPGYQLDNYDGRVAKLDCVISQLKIEIQVVRYKGLPKMRKEVELLSSVGNYSRFRGCYPRHSG